MCFFGNYLFCGAGGWEVERAFKERKIVTVTPWAVTGRRATGQGWLAESARHMALRRGLREPWEVRAA